ncbi:MULTISPECIES: hypothetical protein [unclassified Rickettsia]
MIKSRHDTAFFQRSYTSGLDHGIQPYSLACLVFPGPRSQATG